MGGLKICVIGGGSTYTPELIEGFIETEDELPVAAIALMDIDERGDHDRSTNGGMGSWITKSRR